MLIQIRSITWSGGQEYLCADYTNPNKLEHKKHIVNKVQNQARTQNDSKNNTVTFTVICKIPSAWNLSELSTATMFSAIPKDNKMLEFSFHYAKGA